MLWPRSGGVADFGKLQPRNGLSLAIEEYKCVMWLKTKLCPITEFRAGHCTDEVANL